MSKKQAAAVAEPAEGPEPFDAESYLQDDADDASDAPVVATEAPPAAKVPHEPHDPPPAEQMLSAASTRVADWRNREAAGEREFLEKRRGQYTAILLRADAPRADDAQTLAGLMMDLELTPQAVESDMEIVRAARQKESWHEQLAEAGNALTAASEAYHATEKRHREEERDAFRQLNRAIGHHDSCSNAAYELTKLARRQPLLFQDGNPPRLRSPALAG